MESSKEYEEWEASRVHVRIGASLSKRTYGHGSGFCRGCFVRKGGFAGKVELTWKVQGPGASCNICGACATLVGCGWDLTKEGLTQSVTQCAVARMEADMRAESEKRGDH